MFNNFFSVISRSEPFPSLRNMAANLWQYGRFWQQLQQLRRQLSKRMPVAYTDLYPQLLDCSQDHGFDRHYIYHTAWAARILAKTKPKRHVDISSSLYFSGIVSAFLKVDFYDFRRAQLKLSNLKTGQADLTKLPFKTQSLNSVSCMHTIEHIGLGRYGGQIDADGDLKAIQELIRVVAKGGQLLLVVPIGKQMRVMFNAHRIYTAEYIKKQFQALQLKEFALIQEHSQNGIIRNPTNSLIRKENYACGCFWFVKK